MTKQRKAILRVIRETEGHYTAAEIFDLVKREYPEMARATVYNNLHSMEQEGVIRRLTFSGLADRYDRSPIPHVHLFCSRCGAIADTEIPNFSAYLEEHLKIEFDSYDLTVHYLCPHCQEKANQK